MSSTERMPPHSVESERAVLGSILRLPTAMTDVLTVIKADDFYLDAHQKLFRAGMALWDKSVQVDVETLADELRQRGQVEDVGGYPYLGELLDAAPTAANAIYYANIVRDHALRRCLIHTATEVLRDAYERRGPSVEAVEEAERKVFAVAARGLEGTVADLEAVLDAACVRLDARSEGRGACGVRTGFSDVDYLTAGFQQGELVTLAARASVGKSALALNLARHCVQRGEAVFLASLEMGKAEIGERLLVMESGVDGYRVRHGRLSQDDMLAWAESRRRFLPQAAKLLHVDDMPGQTSLRIAANARRMKLRYNIRLVIVDYLQLVEPDDRRVVREQQVACVTRRLKILARDLGVPVLVLAQINREGEASDRPRMRHLRESGAVEQDSDAVLILHRPRDDDPVHELFIDKQRNGPTGKVSLYFRKEVLRFEDHCDGEDVA